MQNRPIIKVLLVGNGENRNQFNRLRLSAYKSTIGVDFYDIDRKDVKLRIWDTAGMERFGSLPLIYLKDTQAIILCNRTPQLQEMISKHQGNALIINFDDSMNVEDCLAAIEKRVQTQKTQTSELPLRGTKNVVKQNIQYPTTSMSLFEKKKQPVNLTEFDKVETALALHNIL